MCAAPLRGIAAIATLERFVVYCSSELIISGRAPGHGPEGTGSCSSCYASGPSSLLSLTGPGSGRPQCHGTRCRLCRCAASGRSSLPSLTGPRGWAAHKCRDCWSSPCPPPGPAGHVDSDTNVRRTFSKLSPSLAPVINEICGSVQVIKEML